MSHIYLDPDNQPDFSPNPSTDSKQRSYPMKPLNGSKTLEEKNHNLDNLFSTASNSTSATDDTSRNGIQSPQEQNNFFVDYSDDDLEKSFPIGSAMTEDSYHNPSQNLIQPSQAEVYPEAKMQEEKGALESLDIGSDMDIVNHFSGNENFLNQDQIYQAHNVLHPVERSQCHSLPVNSLVELNMRSLESSYYGNHTEENGINLANPQQDIFPADMNNSFDRPNYDDNFETSPKKKVCLSPRILREGQEHLPLEAQIQAISQTLLQMIGQRITQASEMGRRPQETESLNPSFMVNNNTQDASFNTGWLNNFIPISMDTTHQLERTLLIIPEISNEQPGRLSEGTMNLTDMPSDTSISGPQSNSNLSRPSSLNSEVPKKGKRSGQHYLRDFVNGMLKMTAKGIIGSSLDDLERPGTVTKQDVISHLQKIKEAAKTSEKSLKNAVRKQSKILKEATLMLVKEFITEEKYKHWALNEYEPHNSGCNHMSHKEDEEEKQRKRQGYLDKRDKLCKKFLICFQG